MKKLLLIPIIVLLFAVNAWAIGPATLMMFSGDPCADTLCADCDYQERWECGATAGGEDSDQEQTWVDRGGTGAWTDNYTTTVLEGSQSLFANDDELRCIESVSYTEVWVAGMVYLAGGEYQVIFELNAAGANPVRLSVTWDTDHYHAKVWYNNVTNSITGTTELSAGNTYYFKLHYKKGTGADAQVHVWLELNDPFVAWDSVDISKEDCPDQMTVTRVCVKGDIAAASGIIIDDIRIDGADIDY